jgi:alkanesulfonate monooxygenase SsuD/methylene tetrahydromethanopterin reductase-like flavin-dependent oxidoreductase (luciferase family)
MKIGFFSVGIGPTTEPNLLRVAATTAERLGFATLWAPEHVVLVNQYASKYPYSSGEFPAPPNIPIGDPFTTLAYAAACTSTIRLGTGIWRRVAEYGDGWLGFKLSPSEAEERSSR